MKSLFAITICYYFLQITRGSIQGQKMFLIEAVKQRNIETLKWLLNEKANVNVQDDEGRTPLIHASAMENNTDILELLLSSGADPDISQYDGRTALHIATEMGIIDYVKLLFMRMKDVSIRDKLGNCVLHSFLFSYKNFENDTSILSYFLDRGFNNSIKDEFGNPPLLTAAVLGEIAALKVLLLDVNTDVNSTSNIGQTALHMASISGNDKAINLLIENHIDIEKMDDQNNTALHAAASSGDLNSVQLLVESNALVEIINSDGQTPLFVATKSGHYEVSEYLVNKGSDILIVDKYNNTLMHVAAYSGNVELIKYYLEKNLEINNANQYGKSPIVIATEEGHKDAVKYLSENGADLNIFSELGIHFLKDIISKNKTESLQCLIENDKKLFFNVIDSRDVTMLHLAAKHSNVDMLNVVLEFMVSEYINTKTSKARTQNSGNKFGICFPCYLNIANVKDMDGRTPLLYAALHGNLEAAINLINHGAFMNMPDKHGQIALHVAASMGNTNILNLLSQYHPDWNVRDNNNKTALFLAVEAGHLDTVKYLINVGADYSLKDSKKRNLLHVSASESYLSITEELLKLDDFTSNEINSLDEEEKTPAWYAINNRDWNILNQLMLNGAQIDQDYLCEEIDNGHLSLLQPSPLSNQIFHVKINADATLTTVAIPEKIFNTIKEYPCFMHRYKSGRTNLLYEAIENQLFDVTDALEAAGNVVVPNITILEAVKRNQVGFVRYLLNKGVSPKSADEGGWPIIFLASLYGHNDIIQILINSGVQADSPIPGWDWSPLDVATWVGHCSTAEILLKNGARPKRSDRALYNSKPSCKDVLRYYGA